MEKSISPGDRRGGAVIWGQPRHRRRWSRVETAGAALALARGVAERIYFAGQRQPSPRITLALMSACDLFVLNCTYEGLPHVVSVRGHRPGAPSGGQEAAVGGTPELVQDGQEQAGRWLLRMRTRRCMWSSGSCCSTPLERQKLRNRLRAVTDVIQDELMRWWKRQPRSLTT